MKSDLDIFPGVKIFTCDAIPPDQLLFILPGEAVDVIGPDGRLIKRVTVRAPRIDVIYNKAYDAVLVSSEWLPMVSSRTILKAVAWIGEDETWRRFTFNGATCVISGVAWWMPILDLPDQEQNKP